MKIQDLRKLKDEIERLGGIKEVERQLELNTTLENRRTELETGNDALRRTRASLDEGMAKRLQDDQLEQEKHEQRMAKNGQEHEESVRRMDAEKTRITNENSSLRTENATLKTENVALREENKISRWILSLAQKDKRAIQTATDYIAYPAKYHVTEPPPQVTESMRDRLISLLGDELTAEGLLVPVEWLIELKTELAVARKESYMNRMTVQLTLGSLLMLMQRPLEMTTDQRRAMLWVVKQIEPCRSPVGLRQFVKALENSETCPAHHMPMVFDDQRGQWVCPVLNCTCRR